jgi:hypothetical protein
LYQIAISGNTMGSSTSKATLGDSTYFGRCSPITEFLASSASTTLTAAITSTTSTSVSVASGTSFSNNDYIQIDSEIMHITTLANPLTVTRGQLGTTGAAHTGGAAVQDIQDWLYLSVTANGTGNGCSGACLYNYSVTTTTAPSDATTGITATGGTSGAVVDNFLTGTGESEIYYSTLGNATCAGNGTTGSNTHGCAVQASQPAP